MQKFHIRLIFIPDSNKFQLTLGNRRWLFSPNDIKVIIDDARKQIVDATDAMTQFNLKTPELTIELKSVHSRNVFAQILNYLDKVWTSFQAIK